MLSWVFRHRARLQIIYGKAPWPALAGRRFAATTGTQPVPAAQPAAGDARGQLARVVLVPKPRRAG